MGASSFDITQDERFSVNRTEVELSLKRIKIEAGGPCEHKITLLKTVCHCSLNGAHHPLRR